jgi:DNA repair photolyase
MNDDNINVIESQISFDHVILDADALTHPRAQHFLSLLKTTKNPPLLYMRGDYESKAIEQLQKAGLQQFFKGFIGSKPTIIQEYEAFYNKIGTSADARDWLKRRKVLHLKLSKGGLIHPAKVKGVVCPLRYMAHPYINCIHNCLYCYVPSVFPAVPVVVNLNSPEILELELKSGRYDGKVVDIGSFSDPLSLLDEYFMLIPAIIEVFKNTKTKLYILTKSHRVEHIVNVAKGMENLLIGFSVTHCDSEIKKEWEPYASTYEEIKAAIKLLHDNDIEVGVRIDPIIHGYNDHLKTLSRIIDELSPYVVNFTFGVYREKPYIKEKSRSLEELE